MDVRPHQLGEASIRKHLDGMRSRVQRACFDGQVIAGTGVSLKVAVAPIGAATVTSNKPRVDAVACVAALVEKHPFPRSEKGGAASYTFIAGE